MSEREMSILERMTDKQLILETLGGLPESASWDQIQNEFNILAAIREGEKAADDGALVSHEEVAKQIDSWSTKYSGQSHQ